MCRNLGSLHVFAVSVRSGDEHWHNFSDFSLKGSQLSGTSNRYQVRRQWRQYPMSVFTSKKCPLLLVNLLCITTPGCKCQAILLLPEMVFLPDLLLH